MSFEKTSTGVHVYNQEGRLGILIYLNQRVGMTSGPKKNLTWREIFRQRMRS